jgi:hypothetical protein
MAIGGILAKLFASQEERKMPFLTKIHDRWNRLRYWQKGSIGGGVFHIFCLSFIITAAIIFIPKLPPPGSGDMGPPQVWIIYGLYILLELIPIVILYPILYFSVGVKLSVLEAYSSQETFAIWILFIIYSTAVYAILGMAIGKTIDRLKDTQKRDRQ